jgi:hypothetical protein
LVRWNAAQNVVSCCQQCPNPLQELEKRLRIGDWGDSAEAIISFSKQIAELDQSISREQLKSLLERNEVSKKRWEQLCRVGRDTRLSKYFTRLPSTFTAIYALTTLAKDELNDGMVTGELGKTISSRKIYSYAQTFRLREKAFSKDYNILPCYLAIGRKGEGLDKGDLEKIFDTVNQTLIKSGLMILTNASSTTKFIQRQRDLIAKEKKQGTIETEIEHQMYMRSHKLNDHYSSDEIYDIMENDMGQFARALQVISRSRLEMMEVYGELYCYKIALEYHRSDSRVQRFNYKRRLVHVQQKYKFLSDAVEKIFDELVERPKTVE